ncbi:ATP-binding cassette domain-containing protein [Paenibacillus sp. sptzw28]|uniref:ATP-binding cassette domain-containing protein n=1 Tax=Paenibacillus sp. sptzw28 TaxID=715179 RepID=UPI001C6ED4FD|nr:ATP-binding cassette domain-containing protein [Paenibacillus sp. sptzw28]QYR22458.1 ATP-binding cassette domain-containing protein [Paenibacillus sp. sptzw28]
MAEGVGSGMMKERSVPLIMTGLKDMDGQYTECILEQGTITLLMGPNGAGKTRLMEITAGLVYSSEITVSYGDGNMWNHPRLRRRIRNSAALFAYSYASQAPEEQLFSRTVADELHYVLKPYDLPELEKERRIDEALTAVGWSRAWLERDPYKMSGGQRRRTALACLFAPPAPWLLLDEPTAGLDAQGHALLGAALKKCTEDKQGVLLISHDADWALGLADRILLMNADGAVRQCGRDELLANPEWFGEAGMAVPEWLMFANGMWKLGVPPHRVWNPAELAVEIAQLAEAGRLKFAANEEGLARGAKPLHSQDEESVYYSKQPPNQMPVAKSQTPPGEQKPKRKAGAQSRLALFDPRSVWLAYILLSTGMFLQKTWTGIAWIGLLTAVIIGVVRLPLLRWRGPIAALGLFSLMIAVFAGIGGGGSGPLWNTEAFLVSLRSLTRPWLAMLLGLVLPLAISPLRLRRSLEQTLTIRGLVPFLGQKIILTVTLLLRFIPILLGEWERFSRIAIARGKAARRARGAAGRLRDTAIPFLLSLFRLGEQVADALESRGVGKRRHSALPPTERWRLRDSLLVAGCLGITVFLWWWAGGSGT